MRKVRPERKSAEFARLLWCSGVYTIARVARIWRTYSVYVVPMNTRLALLKEMLFIQ
jgi:hypothetical protein